MATKIVLNKKKASNEFGIIGIQSFNNGKKTAKISVTGSCSFMKEFYLSRQYPVRFDPQLTVTGKRLAVIIRTLILKMKIQLLFLIIFSLCLSNCKNSSNESIDRINDDLNWTKTNYALWKSKNGDLGIKTVEVNDDGSRTNIYITKLSYNNSIKEKSINSVIDTLTFEYLGSSFYKDKKNVYRHYLMSDGGNFAIVENSDVKTFKVIGDCYAKDKNYIYGERAMRMDSVDYETFKTEKGFGPYAKDKNGFYFWDTKIDLKEIENTETEKIIEQLKKL